MWDRIVYSSLRAEKIRLVVIYNSVVREMNIYMITIGNKVLKRRLEVEDYFAWIDK